MNTFRRQALWEDDDKWKTLGRRAARVFIVSAPGHGAKRIRAKTKAQAVDIYRRVRQLTGENLQRVTVREEKQAVVIRR